MALCTFCSAYRPVFNKLNRCASLPQGPCEHAGVWFHSTMHTQAWVVGITGQPLQKDGNERAAANERPLAARESAPLPLRRPAPPPPPRSSSAAPLLLRRPAPPLPPRSSAAPLLLRRPAPPPPPRSPPRGRAAERARQEESVWLKSQAPIGRRSTGLQHQPKTSLPCWRGVAGGEERRVESRSSGWLRGIGQRSSHLQARAHLGMLIGSGAPRRFCKARQKHAAGRNWDG